MAKISFLLAAVALMITFEEGKKSNGDTPPLNSCWMLQLLNCRRHDGQVRVGGAFNTIYVKSKWSVVAGIWEMSEWRIRTFTFVFIKYLLPKKKVKFSFPLCSVIIISLSSWGTYGWASLGVGTFRHHLRLFHLFFVSSSQQQTLSAIRFHVDLSRILCLANLNTKIPVLRGRWRQSAAERYAMRRVTSFTRSPLLMDWVGMMAIIIYCKVMMSFGKNKNCA